MKSTSMTVESLQDYKLCKWILWFYIIFKSKQLNQQYTMQPFFYESMTTAVKVLNERELFIYLFLCVCSTLGKRILFCWNPVKFLGVLCNQLKKTFRVFFLFYYVLILHYL